MIEILCIVLGVFIGYTLLHAERRARFFKAISGLVASVRDPKQENRNPVVINSKTP